MAIEKNSFKGSRFDKEFSPNSKETTSSDEEEVQLRASADESDDDDDEFNDADSGAGSDDFDLLELGETGAEFCQIGNSTCSLPFELYDLSGLKDILSVDVWNEVLSEEDRFSLAKYLPDLDQHTFMRTVKELLEGQNLHFGSPVEKLFEMLKGGLCEPRVALYRQGLNFFQKRQHYHLLRKHQNTMVSNLCKMRDAWFSCRGYSIEEKLRVLSIMKSETNLMCENLDEGLASDSSEKQALAKKGKDRKNVAKLDRSLEFPPRMPSSMGLEAVKYGKQNPKGILKLAGSKTLSSSRFPPVYQGMDVNSRPYGLPTSTALRLRDPMRIDDDVEDELAIDSFSGFPFALKNDFHGYGKFRNANKLSEVKLAAAKVSNRQSSQEFSKKAKYPEKFQQFDQMKLPKGSNRAELLENGEPIWHSNNQKFDDWSMKKKSLDLNLKNYGSASPTLNDRILLSELRSRPSQERVRESFGYNGGLDNRRKKMNRMYARNEETESDDSSEQFHDEEEDSNLLIRGKFAYPPSNLPKKGKFVKKTMEDIPPLALDGMPPILPSKPKQKGKIKDDSRKRIHKLGKNGQLQESVERLHISSPFDLKQKGDEEDDSLETRLLADENTVSRLRKKGQGSEAFFRDISDGFKKRKAKEELTDIDGRDDVILPCNGRQLMEEPVSLKKKKGKKKVEADTDIGGGLNEPIVSEIGAMEIDIEAKPPKKPYTPITPTVHTGFSFSVIHLLSAVRMAMISPLAEDYGKHESNANEAVVSVSLENAEEAGKLDNGVKANGPSLTLQEIVNRVRSNPGDPCILETQEPLQDLVRGVLKILASKTAPLGAKGWKPLVVFQKSTKRWSWIGPTSESLTDHDTIEEVTSPDYWVLPHKMLVKLVDSFANWLKSGQETLQQIGILPAPPVSLMQSNLDEKERFKDLRAQKSLHTINPSSEEVRDYFRKEEILRYSIPDRAFNYTAADGKKSIVAPLRRCGGKPTSKARDHFMLKRDRPPHVTILCLVRDAAARLPGSIGTRADVCTLIRDSQFVVEDVSDAQVNQVVSGALDRLHYERDPCVQFDGERKLWVYLHREREEEDFEDDGTSSTKKWKRQKKDPADQSEQAAVPVTTVGFNENVDQPGFDLGSDLNVDPPGIDEDKGRDFVNQIVDENGEMGQPMVWDSLNLNPVQGSKLLCQENSRNQDFDEEMFGRERAVGL